MNLQKIKVNGLYYYLHEYGRPVRVTNLLPENKGHVVVDVLEYREDGDYTNAIVVISGKMITTRSIKSLWSEHVPKIVEELRDAKIAEAQVGVNNELWLQQHRDEFKRVIHLFTVTGLLEEAPRASYHDRIAMFRRRRWERRNGIVNFENIKDEQPGNATPEYDLSLEEFDKIAQLVEGLETRNVELTQELLHLKYSGYGNQV